jgi:hypothetical protein
VDGTGHAYVVGNTTSTDFPTANPFDGTLGGVQDVIVAKLAADGGALLYSTYLGGSNEEQGFGISVDDAGAAYVTGDTSSSDFPLVNPIDNGLGGFNQAFVAKLTPAGNALAYSTYLGGGSADMGIAIAADTAGHAYVIGSTLSDDFPVVNAFDDTAARFFIVRIWVGVMSSSGVALP